MHEHTGVQQAWGTAGGGQGRQDEEAWARGESGTELSEAPRWQARQQAEQRRASSATQMTAHTESRQVAVSAFSSIRVLPRSAVRRIAAASPLTEQQNANGQKQKLSIRGRGTDRRDRQITTFKTLRRVFI